KPVIVPGDQSADASYLTGYASSAWVAFMFALRTAATGPVQTKIDQGSAMTISTLASPPTPGNFLMALVFGQNIPEGTITPGEDGWARVAGAHLVQPTDATRHREVLILSRCYTAGDGALPNGTRWTWTISSQGCLVWMSEWAWF